jgi:hypothetical protein
MFWRRWPTLSESTGLLAGWLALREPADASARSATLTDAVIGTLRRDRAARAVDLGTGTGANIRYLMPRIPAAQDWLAVDRDPVLLTHLPNTIVTLQRELGVLDRAMFEGRDLVTASALLDLVSPAWIDELAHQCRTAGAAVIFALSYDGTSQCDPCEPEDDLVLDLFNRHQRASDKGFGAAAGPDAAAVARRAFAAVGYHMSEERSDWHLTPPMRQLQQLLVTGWADAATDVAPDQSTMIADWLRRRIGHVQSGRSHIVVGHVDLGGSLVR